jgi:hypothetical protein
MRNCRTLQSINLKTVLSCCSSDLTAKTRFPQLYVYDICLTRFGDFHQWMAFLDPDEYLVLQSRASAERLPEFLKVLPHSRYLQ